MCARACVRARGGVQGDPVVLAKLAAAAGLNLLLSKRYKLAARKLLEVTADLGSAYSDVLAMQVRWRGSGGAGARGRGGWTWAATCWPCR